MSLGLKERTANDPLEVRALFALYRAFGKDGRLWIKHDHYRRFGGEVYRTLVGGVHSISNQPEFKRAHMREAMFQLLYSALPRYYRNAHVLSYAGACRDFNDRLITNWSDVETAIRRAIEIGRERANA
jgi:hypothetical protein